MKPTNVAAAATAASPRSKSTRAKTTMAAIRRIPLLLVSYVVTIASVMQSQMNSATSDAPFLTHLDLTENGGGDWHGASCSQRTHRTLHRLIAKMTEDLDNALIPLNVSLADVKNHGMDATADAVTMPGLRLSSFRGRRIAFLGDSTLFYLAKWLFSMLRHEDASVSGGNGNIDYDTMKFDQANSVVQRNKQFVLAGTTKPPPYQTDGDGTWFQWWGMQGNAHGRTEELLEAMFRESEQMRAEVLVVNMAFHWFHLCGYSKNMCPTPIDSPIIVRWLHYREAWLQRVYDYAVKVDAKLLLFKTANFICGTARTGEWATGDELYQKFDNATLDACSKRLEPLGKELSVSAEDVARYCRHGQFTEVGSRYLNDLMAEFVESLQEKDRIEGGGRLVVGIFNDHDVESCYTTDDAIHHKRGNVMRLRLLANTIDSYLKCSSRG